MWSKIIILTHMILVAQSITVPPFWPKQNADVLPTANIRLPIQQYTNIPPKSLPIENYHYLHSTPIVQQNHEVHLPSTQYPTVTPKLQYRSPVNQEVYIYHPPPPTSAAIKNIQLENHKPSSYQIVNFDNQEKDIIIHSKPKSNLQPEKYLKISNQKPYGENERLVNKEVKENDSVGNVEQTDEFKGAINEHEFPRKVPTKPIYPGEGKWADYQLRHTPYIDNKKEDPSHRQEENERNAEGYDTFEQGQEQFQQAQNKFRHGLDTFPQNHNLNPSQIDDVNTESQPLYEKPEIDFVPQKLYAQVRRTETEQHLPKSAIDPEQEENAARLREVIKDSKIHTVYSEEGYEDSAYDHAGHEKHAEHSEGHAQLSEDEAKSSNEKRGNGRSKNSGNRHNGRGRNIERRKLRNNETGTDEHYNELSKYSKFRKMEQDADSASSNTESKRVVTNLDEFPTKNMKTVKLQIGDKEGMDMEIHTEVKYVPGTPQKKHKFIKIIPSYKKHVDLENKNNSSEKSLKRVKRYDKNDLSKRYIRKRPNYYWKKVKTSTTERPLLNMRRKFEAAFKNHNRSIKTISTDKPLHDDKRQENSTVESTILSTTVTTTSTTPIPPATPSIDDILETHEVTTKSSKPNPSKVKLRKYIFKRQKRFTIDHPNINVDLKEFIDVKALPNPTPKPDLTYLKYPYYKSPITDKFNEYSPLRYAEDMENIPRKTEDLSFYESRSHIICPQIESNVDPIPDRIKEQEEETVKVDEEKDHQRMSGLGDKIDCLKIKYFGENPLDSPLFQEEFIDEPLPVVAIKNINKDNKNKVKVLSEIDSVNNIYLKPRKYDNNAEINEKINDDSKNSIGIAQLSPEKLDKHKNDLKVNQLTFDEGQNVRAKKRELKIKILEPIIVVDEEMFSTTTLNPILKKSDAVLKPPFTLLEMVDRNLKKMKLKPKSIYDQITILEEENNKSTVMSDKVFPLSEKFVIIYDNEDNTNVNKITTEHPLENKIKMIKPAIGGYKSPKVSDLISDLTIYSQDIEQPEVINLLLDKTSTKTRPTNPGQTSQNNEDQRKERLTPKISVRKPVKSPRISNRKLQRTTFRPDITTSSQTGTTEESLRPKSEIPQSETITQGPIIALTTESSLSIKNPHAQISRRSSLPYIFDISRFLPKIPNHKIITSEVHYKDEIKPSEQMKMYSDVLKTINEEIEILSEQSNTSNATFAKTTEQESADTNIHDETVIQNKQKYLQNAQFPSTKSIIHNDRISEPSSKVIDLVPPSNGSPYRTLLQNPISYKENHEPTLEIPNTQSTQNINNYYVIGLKPPPKNDNFQIYRKINKRQITQNSQSLQGINHQMVNEKEKIHNSIPFGPIGNERFKRDVSEIDYNLDDLVAEESRTYEVTPSRKPKVYTEIVRAKPAKTEIETDSEDLNPRKRVYELKPVNSVSTENTINFEEVIEDEIENQTESPTSAKPIIYPVEANSDNPSIAQYVFLIDRLHDKWERENPPTTMKTDSIPETTSQVSVAKPTEATQSVAESINIPSGEPAFLQIINQLHNVREEEEKKNPPSTTTTAAASVIIEENSPSSPVKNSNPYNLESIIPESFMSELNSMQAKLDPEKSNDNSNQDGFPRSRNFSAKFKTSIDTSKYQTIARNPVSFRHNLSSRYNADDQELPLSKVHTTQLPTVVTTKSQEDILTHQDDNAATTIAHDNDMMTTNKAETEIILTTTARTRKQSRSRSRPTTTTTTQKPTSVTINPTFRRRRPTRITTEATISTIKSESLHTRRRSRFRPESQIRLGASESPTTKYGYTSTMETPKTEETITTDSNTPEDNKKQRRLQTIHERRVVSEVTLTRFYEPSSDESGSSSSNENVEESKRHQYQIAGPLAHDDATELYSDPELAKNVNQLKDEQQPTTERNQKLSSLVNTKEIVDKFETIPTNGAVNLYPNMARMINRLAESQPESTLPLSPDASSEDDVEDGSSTEEKPVFVKDPSKRMYYYAKL